MRLRNPFRKRDAYERLLAELESKLTSQRVIDHIAQRIAESDRDAQQLYRVAWADQQQPQRDAERQPGLKRTSPEPDARHYGGLITDSDGNTRAVSHLWPEPQPGAVVGQPEQPAEPEPGYDPATGVYTLSDDERSRFARVEPRWAEAYDNWAPSPDITEDLAAHHRAVAAYLRARADSDGEQPGAHGGR